jgi:hypothetical protein
MDYKRGDRVFIWQRNGWGIYDGQVVIVAACENGRLTVTEPDGTPIPGTISADAVRFALPPELASDDEEEVSP